VKIGIGKLNGSAGTEAEIDGIEDRRFSGVARSD